VCGKAVVFSIQTHHFAFDKKIRKQDTIPSIESNSIRLDFIPHLLPLCLLSPSRSTPHKNNKNGDGVTGKRLREMEIHFNGDYWGLTKATGFWGFWARVEVVADLTRK